MGLKTKLRDAAPMLLCFIATGGVIGTAVLAAKATPEAESKIRADSRRNHDGDPYAYTKKEAIKSAWKCYIPAVGVGVGTVACIFGATILTKRSQASLVAGYSLMKKAYEEYQNKVKELYGQEAHNAVMDEIVKEKCEFPGIYASGICGGSSLGIDSLEQEVKRTFYDVFSKRYFESTLSDVMQAEYHLNRDYVLGRIVTLNELYEFLGIAPVSGGDNLKWSMCDDEIYWIDFNHRVAILDDGMEVVLIEMVFVPRELDEE